MIPPHKRPMFRAWFGRHVRGRLLGRFGAVRVVGLEAARARVAAGPVIVVSNHQSWWDPLVALFVEEQLGADGYALMDARNLRRLPFFRFVGALGVDLEQPGDGAVALRACARLLDRPGRLLWIFPQGRERPEDPRPLGFRPGSAALARLARDAVTLPVAIRYVFAGDEFPELVVSIGAALPRPEPGADTVADHEAAVVVELDRIDAWLAAGTLVEQPAALQRSPDRVGRLAEALLAWFSGLLLPAPPRPAPGGHLDRSAGAAPATPADG